MINSHDVLAIMSEQLGDELLNGESEAEDLGKWLESTSQALASEFSERQEKFREFCEKEISKNKELESSVENHAEKIVRIAGEDSLAAFLKAREWLIHYYYAGRSAGIAEFEATMEASLNQLEAANNDESED